MFIKQKGYKMYDKSVKNQKYELSKSILTHEKKKIG